MLLIQSQVLRRGPEPARAYTTHSPFLHTAICKDVCFSDPSIAQPPNKWQPHTSSIQTQ
ncbi:hypothetical protein BD413DRAFT_508589 [Trametes elegans]|nr:hypothetical protein BD413DRAFT_508589 [Trametes elegans]